MVVSISAVLLCGLVVAVLIKHGHVRIFPALACAAFGFFFASTAFAPAINGAIGVVTGWLSIF
ncbi:hypothetical protein OG894_42025 (plasmid) [Streptomyces sp. NBC_01724]|uniref:hypothetical protein n=1 Tax=Streptomyces sp. NBC_01724 TaxID=2975922 RepID=UPI002E3107D8|nr:hypothetical protein [Streptomyces sp. NBC_01724]